MKKIVNKLLVTVLIIQLIMLNTIPVYAQEVSPTPSETTVSSETTQSPPPPEVSSTTESTQTQQPSDVSTVSDSSTPSSASTTSNIVEPSATISEITPTPSTGSGPTAPDSLSNWNNLTDEQKDEYRNEQKEKAENNYLASLGLAQTTSSGNSGDTALATGNAQNSATLTNSANNNFSSSPLNGDSEPSASVANSDNGSFSSNNGSAAILNNNDTDQENSARVISGLNADSTTGNNNGNYNVGSTDVSTGDANTTGTIINAVNTNVDGVMVSEFNIVDDHVGDIVLDFNANCISGCGLLGLSAQNTGNGAFSDNDADAQAITNNNTFQNNTGTVGNEMVLSADSGNNSSSYNTGGDSTITTGDANIAGNALTFLNNNIAGNVIYSVVNIFGDLTGDIIFPESQLSCCGGSSTSVENTGNGAFSDNNASASTTTNNATFQNNDATINNNLVFDANTGDNSAGFNTGGNSTINTGQANVDANVLNIANTNIVGGNMWLVLINHAGNWIGKLMGAAPGASYGGSEGLEFVIGPSGEINVSNTDNGANSSNNAVASTTTNNTTVQNNTATVNNTLRFDANTGGNDANFNTGGNSTINTGDANIIANLVNFVNNNISGGGKLFVTVVNVFGSWTGDFVGPGQQKENKESGITNHESSNDTTSGNNSNGVLGLLNQSNASRPSNSSNTSSSGNDQKAGAVTVSSNFNNTGNANGATTGSTNNATNTQNQNGLLASTKVLAMNTQNDGANKDKKVTINLAWLMLLLPLFALGFVLRKLISKFLAH